MLPILVFFLLFDRKSVINSVLAVLPKNRPMLSNIWEEMDGQLSNYVRGKSIEIMIVGFAAAIIFSLFGLQYTALLSVLVGFSVLIPFLGAFIATIPVAIIGLLQFGLTFDFWMLIGAYILLQILDGNVLVPILFQMQLNFIPSSLFLQFLFLEEFLVSGGLFCHTYSHFH